MKSAKRIDLGLSAALFGLFLAGLATWGMALFRERAESLRVASDRLERVAQQVRDEARCVELFAERTLPGGSEFYLIAPSDTNAQHADTIAHYRVHTAGPDTLLRRSRFPIDLPAAMRVHVQLDFLLPMIVNEVPDGSSDGNQSVFADRGLLCAEVEGRRLELVDTVGLTRALRNAFVERAYRHWSASIIDTLTWDTLYRSSGSIPSDPKLPAVRSTSIAPPSLVPWVLVVALPDATTAALWKTLPYLGVFLALFGALVFTLWRSRRAWSRERQFALMQMDLVSNITHEFNTPLTHISLALDALRRTDLQVQHAHMLNVIAEENERMQANVKKVMAVSLLDQEGLPMELELHDVHELLRSTLRSLEPTLEREGVTLTCSFRAKRSWVLVDATYLTNVFHSILDNAMKYGRAPKQVEIRTADRPEGLWIGIADNGPGIPSSELRLVFQKFYRGTNGREASVKGTGIGLYFARKVMHAHRGTIALSSGPSGGLEVQLTLPEPVDDQPDHPDR